MDVLVVDPAFFYHYHANVHTKQTKTDTEKNTMHFFCVCLRMQLFWNITKKLTYTWISNEWDNDSITIDSTTETGEMIPQLI